MTTLYRPRQQEVIFLGGPDRCGKTNIGRQLSILSGIPLFKPKEEHEVYLNNKDHFVQTLRWADPRVADFVGQTGQSVIFDRGYPCEWVYSRVFGRETDERALAKLDCLWKSLGAKIIVCNRSSFRGIVDDIDPGIDEGVLMKIQAEYDNFIEWTSCDVLKLNVDDENLDREIAEIAEFLGWEKYT